MNNKPFNQSARGPRPAGKPDRPAGRPAAKPGANFQAKPRAGAKPRTDDNYGVYRDAPADRPAPSKPTFSRPAPARPPFSRPPASRPPAPRAEAPAGGKEGGSPSPVIEMAAVLRTLAADMKALKAEAAFKDAEIKALGKRVTQLEARQKAQEKAFRAARQSHAAEEEAEAEEAP